MDYDGVLRRASRMGRTKAEAIRRLNEALADRHVVSGSETVDSNTTLADLAEIWFTELPSSDSAPLPTSIQGYRRALAHILESTGQRRIGDLTPGIIDARIKALPSQDVKRKTRSLLKRMFDLAVLHQAVPHNPVLATSTYKKRPKQINDIPIEQVEVVRKAVADWCGKKRSGPRNNDMVDLIDLLLATGCRIGEVLAIRWSDIDLNSDVPTVSVTGIIEYSAEHGNQRVERAKSESSLRTFVLPPFAVSMLRRRRLAQPPNDLDAVFATRNGTWHTVTNMGTRWRKIRKEAGLESVTFHSFRRTVATQVDAVAGPQVVANLLGHADSGATAERYYINRAKVIVDASQIIQDRLGPVAERPAAT